MKTLEVEFSEEDKNILINEICTRAESEERCHSRNGHEFAVKFNEELQVFAKVLIDDDFSNRKPSRYVSTNIEVITVETFDKVKSNLNSEFEDKINSALIKEFHKMF